MFWKIFVKLCSEHNTKPNPVAKLLNISSGAVTKWKAGAMPNDTTLYKIANYFGVTIEYLKGEEETEATVENEYSPIDEQEKTLLKLFRGTTEEGRMRIIQAVLNICDEVEITLLNGKNYNSAG